MIIYGNDLTIQHADGLRGGHGATDVAHYLGPEETDGKVGLCNRITLMPGSSIGEHPHISDAEIYFVLEGELVFTENGREQLLRAGDLTYTSHGATHGMENRSGAPAAILAVVVQ